MGIPSGPPGRGSKPGPPAALWRLELATLGGFSARARGAEVGGFESRKARAVLAYLALQEFQAVSRDRLGVLFWPDSEPAAGRRNLRQVIFNLRSVLGAAETCLVATANEVGLAPGSMVVDALHFQSAAREGLEGPGPASLDALGRALDLYRGELLAGLTVRDAERYEEWRERERARLHELAAEVAREALRRSEADGQLETALGFARRLAELDPLSEEGCRARMRLLSRLGRRAQALEEYVGFAGRLRRELDVGPGEELLELQDAIRAERELPESDADRPGPAGPIVPLVGREAEARELGRIWNEVRNGECRLTLVAGARGAGKSRLVRTFVWKALAGVPGTVLLARGTSSPEEPFRALLAEAVASLPIDVQEGARPGLTVALRAALAALPEVHERRRDLPPAAQRWRGDPLDAAAGLLRELAHPGRPGASGRVRPVVLFVDELERSPQALDGLAELARRVGERPVWILAAVRSDELGEAGVDALRSTVLAAGGAVLELGALAREEVERAARGLVGVEGSEPLAEALFAASAGEPLALAEAVNLLADLGALRQGPGGVWILTDAGAPARELVAGADRLVDRRLELLPRTSRRVIGLAAIVGERFDAPTLLEAEGEHPAVLEVALQILIERWMVRPSLGSWAVNRRDRDLAIWKAGARHGPFEFAQRTIRERLLAGIDPDRRRALEARIEGVRQRLHGAAARPGAQLD